VKSRLPFATPLHIHNTRIPIQVLPARYNERFRGWFLSIHHYFTFHESRPFLDNDSPPQAYNTYFSSHPIIYFLFPNFQYAEILEYLGDLNLRLFDILTSTKCISPSEELFANAIAIDPDSLATKNHFEMFNELHLGDQFQSDASLEHLILLHCSQEELKLYLSLSSSNSFFSSSFTIFIRMTITDSLPAIDALQLNIMILPFYKTNPTS
jgi:hypothetical protein